MATYEKGLLGSFSGPTGTVVGSGCSSLKSWCVYFKTCGFFNRLPYKNQICSSSL